MGLIGRVLSPGAVSSVGAAAEDLSEVFVRNATRGMELDHEAYRMALEAAATEYKHVGNGWFDQFVNGINRLPRPLMALGTVGLFVFAMADPEAFTERMTGLNHVPEPLWWLLGAVVGFYFGARELHYFRSPVRRRTRGARGLLGLLGRRRQDGAIEGTEENQALLEWTRRDLS